MAVVTMRQLLDAGFHFGHQTRRWNPKMRRFIYGERNGIYILDLRQTLTRVESAYTFLRRLSADGGVVLFVGTKKQAQDPVARAAGQVGMPYVNQRWLGGMLTNFETILGRVAKMQEYERMRAAGDFDAMPKKEALILSRELEKLQRNLGGLRGMRKRPDAIFVIDTKKEHLAVTEANKLGIPVVAVLDTNCDPDVIQFPVPGNDDAIRSANLICRVVAEAIAEGQTAARAKGIKSPAANAEEEASRAAQQADARRQAAAQAREREARMATRPAAPTAGAAASDSPEAATTPAE